MEFHEHPKRFLERLLNSQQLRKNALENKRFQTMLIRGNIYKKVHNGTVRGNQEAVVIKKFLKTTYFFANICHSKEF